jgi:hypothetical protein
MHLEGMPVAACPSRVLDIQPKLCGVVFTLTRARRKVSHLPIDVTSHAEEGDAKKDNSGPTQKHENP